MLIFNMGLSSTCFLPGTVLGTLEANTISTPQALTDQGEKQGHRETVSCDMMRPGRVLEVMLEL